MKTPMQEVYENFNLMSDKDFKAWMLNTDLLEKEKEVIMDAYDSGQESNWSKDMGLMGDWYYDETFKTKEK